MQNSDEIKKNLLFIEAMADAMSECDDASIGEIREELKADGIDLDVSVNHLMDFIRICAMDAKRESLDEAANAREVMEAEDRCLVGKFSAYSKDQLLTLIKSLLTLPEEQIGLAYRELDGKNQEDLASILEDLEAAKNLASKKMQKNENHS